MRVSLTINMDNAAFSDEEGGWRNELAAILERQAGQLRSGWYATVADLPTVGDSNGNTVGGWHYRTGPVEG